jgi:hypothetical protein
MKREITGGSQIPSRYFISSLVAPSGPTHRPRWADRRRWGSLFRAAASTLFIHARHTPRISREASQQGKREKGERETEVGDAGGRRRIFVEGSAVLAGVRHGGLKRVDFHWRGAHLLRRQGPCSGSASWFPSHIWVWEALVRIRDWVSFVLSISCSSFGWLDRCLFLKFLFPLFSCIFHVLISSNACKLGMMWD